MADTLFDKMHHINYLTAVLDALYHQASLRLGISDSAMRVLYTIHDQGESCPLSDIYKMCDISKQTVNSAIRKLEKEDILYLEQHLGRTKRVVLTDKGKKYVTETAARLFEAETLAFAAWTEEEIATHIRLMEKYVDSFREQIGKL